MTDLHRAIARQLLRRLRRNVRHAVVVVRRCRRDVRQRLLDEGHESLLRRLRLRLRHLLVSFSVRRLCQSLHSQRQLGHRLLLVCRGSSAEQGRGSEEGVWRGPP
jgi:hypothetical protein